MPPRPPRAADLERGREAYHRREWRAAVDALAPALDGDAAAADDLRMLAMAAYLVGEEPLFVRALERAHHRYREEGDPLAAARCAFWLGLHSATMGEPGRATGWFGRMTRLVEGVEGDTAERGYLLVPVAHGQLMAGDAAGAIRAAEEAVRIGARFADADLTAFALHLEGRARLRNGQVAEGLACLDEAMVAVAGDELSPILTGLLYCSVIGACREVHARGRAHEWTAALRDWCERQPDMVAYSGECRVYRSEILRFHGEWPAAIREAERARDRMGPTAEAGAMALAHYQRGEVHRLRGELAAAESAYQEASRAGREPMPGLALLRLAQGDDEAAAAASRRALAGTPQRWRRARLLPAHIEIMIAVGDLDEAARACDELEAMAASLAPDGLGPVLAHARGAVLLARGDATAALPPLRQAWLAWQELGAPWDAARARELLGRACAAVGDHEGAGLQLAAARAAYESLGAAPDLARLDARRRPDAAGRRHGLTPRELEVLRLVATGRTNRAIAEDLFISEKTVARHVANIFAKLGLSSRAAATAYAYEHDLLGTAPPSA